MTTKLYGGDKRLYTAAEARRIDIERGGEGRIIKPSDYDQNWHLFFHEETRTWRICENQGGQLQHGIYDSPFCLVKEIWSALTPEPEPIVLDYLVLVDANERIKQLEKENESLLAERNRLREWYEYYYTKQPTIEYLQKELAELKKERDNDVHYRLYSSMQKERDEATNNYHEILADHGELTRQFDELTEKTRWKSCKDEKPGLTNRLIIRLSGNNSHTVGGHYYRSWFLHYPLGCNLKMSDEQAETWTWKYEADL